MISSPPPHISTLHSPGFLLFLALLVTNCSTDFEIEAGGRDIPVVYGFIDLRDTAHYIRIERAFLSGEQNTATVAKNVDSLYYDPSVSVFLEKVESRDLFPLERVNGEQEGFPRKDGPFVNSPNIMYKIKGGVLGLQGGEKLRLIIERGGQLPPVTAETTVLSPIDLVDNLPPDPFSLGNYLSTRRIAWRTGADAEIFDLRMYIHYREPAGSNASEMVDRTLEWVLSPSLRREDNNVQVNYSFQVEDFYRFIGGSLQPLSSGRRAFVGLDIEVIGGGPEFADLITIAQANSGITSGSDAIPVYTNISEGRGIFASRTTDRRFGIQLNAVSLDSLRNGFYTGDLGF